MVYSFMFAVFVAVVFFVVVFFFFRFFFYIIIIIVFCAFCCCCFGGRVGWDVEVVLLPFLLLFLLSFTSQLFCHCYSSRTNTSSLTILPHLYSSKPSLQWLTPSHRYFSGKHRLMSHDIIGCVQPTKIIED